MVVVFFSPKEFACPLTGFSQGHGAHIFNLLCHVTSLILCPSEDRVEQDLETESNLMRHQGQFPYFIIPPMLKVVGGLFQGPVLFVGEAMMESSSSRVLHTRLDSNTNIYWLWDLGQVS